MKSFNERLEALKRFKGEDSPLSLFIYKYSKNGRNYLIATNGFSIAALVVSVDQMNKYSDMELNFKISNEVLEFDIDEKFIPPEIYWSHPNDMFKICYECAGSGHFERSNVWRNEVDGKSFNEYELIKINELSPKIYVSTINIPASNNASILHFYSEEYDIYGSIMGLDE